MRTLKTSAMMFVATLVASGPATSADLSEFATNVTKHVLLHELGHALIREFDIPVLANEEDMADSFATIHITQDMRDDAVAILKDRARSWLYEDSEVAPKGYDLSGEHMLDKRRAFRTICLLYGADPSEFSQVVDWIGLSEHDANECTDIAPQMIDSWSAVLNPHMLPEGQSSDNVIVQYGEATWTDQVIASGVVEEVAQVMRRFDWPESVILHFDSCGSEGASWSRSKRKILFCDEYLGRFVRQADMAPPR